MALTDWSPEEIKALQAQGIDPNYATPVPTQDMSKTGAALATAKAHAGGLLGGGVGAIGGMSPALPWNAAAYAAAPETAGVSLLVPLISGAISAGISGYGGQKIQQGVESPETYAAQQEAAAQAAQEHPYVSEATDIGLGALASGGKFSPTTAVKGAQGLIGSLTGRGAGALMAERQAVMGTIDRALTSGDQGTLDAMTARLGEINDALPSAIAKRSAMMNVGLQSALNPALATGMSVAQGNGIPSGSDLAAQSIGGALFAKTWLPQGRLKGSPIEEPIPDANDSNGQNPAGYVKPYESNFSSVDENGNYKIGNNQVKNLFMKKFAAKIPEDATDITKAQIGTFNDNLLKETNVDDMREQLHLAEANESLKEPTVEQSDYQGGEMDSGPRGFEMPETTVKTPIAEPVPEVTNKAVETPVEKVEPATPIPEETTTPIPVAGKSYTPAVKTGRRGEIQKVTIKNPQMVNPVTGESARVNSPPPKFVDDRTPEQQTLHLVNTALTKVSKQELQRRAQAYLKWDKGLAKSTTLVPSPEAIALENVARLTANGTYPEGDNFGKLVSSPPSAGGGFTHQDYSPEDLAKYQSVGKKFVKLSNTEPGSEEHTKTWQEYEALRNKYGGMPPRQLQQSALGNGKVPQIPLGLRQTLLNNKGTVGGLLHSLATSPGHDYQVLTQHLLNASDAKSLNVKIIHDDTLDRGGQRSHYNPSTDEIRLGTSATGDASVALEEAMHAMTDKKLPNFTKTGAEHLKELQEYLKNGKDKNVKDLINSYLETAKAKGWEPWLKGTNSPKEGVANNADRAVEVGLPYGMGNLREFIAQAFKDPDFQKILDGIKTNDGRTIWQHIVDAVRKIIGLNVKHGNMLDKVLRTSFELVAQNRPDGLGRLDLGVHGTNPARERSNKFLVNAAEMVRNSETKLGLKTNSSGAFHGTQLLGTLFNKLTPMEQQIYKDQGIVEHFQNRYVNKEDAVKWLEEHTPQAKVETYGMEGKVSEAKKEYDKMTHEWYDTLQLREKNALMGVNKVEDLATRHGWDVSQVENARRYRQLDEQVRKEPTDTSPRATSYYSTVSALPTDEPMPDWTATKSGKNVQRVDVVVPQAKHGYEEYLRKNGLRDSKYAKDLYKNNTGREDIETKQPPIWTQDNLHENLPNTLGWAMIQYKTGPKGEKIAVIAEAQSRWQQQKRTYDTAYKDRIAKGKTPEEAHRLASLMVDQYRPGMDTPSNVEKDYNRLILKAAIDQARKEGATHIMVSDAETAMMTEGHDRQERSAVPDFQDKETYDTGMNKPVTLTGKSAVRNGMVWLQVKGGDYRNVSFLKGYEHLKPSDILDKVEPPQQEGGMRLHYDTILPKIAEELTGSKGERVSLGEHKNAYTPMRESFVETEATKGKTKLRDNLIFRNADGTPKTDVSGRLYPISNVPDREPMLFGKQYAKPGESPTGELLRYGNKGAAKQGEKVEPIHPTFLGGVGRFMTDALLRARVGARDVADSFHKAFNDRQLIYGKTYGKGRILMDKSFDGHKFDDADSIRLEQARRVELETHKEVPMGFFKNQAQKQVWNEYKKVYREQGVEAVNDKQPIFDYKTKQFRVRQLDPTAHPVMINNKVADIIRAGTDTSTINKYHKDFTDYQQKLGQTPETAEQNWKLLTDAMHGSASGTTDVSNAAHFNANRRAQGLPLPPSMSVNDFRDSWRMWAQRNAADRAYYKNIETNSSVMRQLGETKDAWGNQLPESDQPKVMGNKYVQALVHDFKRPIGPQGFFTERGYSSFATALFIASPALSAVHVPISNICGVISLADNPLQLSKTLLAGLKGMTEGIATAQKNGIMIPNAVYAGKMFDASLTSAERWQAMASVVRRVASFNDLTTKLNVGYMQAAMEYLVPSKLTRAAQGDVNAQQLLRKIDPNYTVGKEYSPEEEKQLSSLAVGYLHGTNDPRTMPEWMLRDSEISGFFSIAHWSVAQTDRFMRDVWMPAKRGNLSPLILGVCGAAVGGEVIKKLREEISGKHSPIPGLVEIINSDRGIEGNAGPLAYNAMAALQFAGFGGLFSTLAKYPFDLAYKNGTQALAFPLDEEVSDIAETAGQAVSAIMNDPNINFVDLAKLVGQHVLTSDFRLTREAYNQMINSGMITGTLAERKQLSDKMSQLRRFEQVEGLPFDQQTESTTNPYMFPEQQEFKKTQDIGQAAHDLPELVNNIMQQYGSNPDVAMAKLKALKETSYDTMPSIENYPLQFQKYIKYLQKMEGPEAAQAAMQDYMKHKITNEVKSSMVP